MTRHAPCRRQSNPSRCLASRAPLAAGIRLAELASRTALAGSAKVSRETAAGASFATEGQILRSAGASRVPSGNGAAAG